MTGTQQSSGGKIFVAWGRNRKLAEAVRDALNSKGYPALLGGDTTDNQGSAYLGERVLKQIRSSAAVVALAEDLDPTPVKDRQYKEAVLRPNLTFEWGYALAKLPQAFVLACLIGFDKSALPSDLQGTWSEHFPNYREDPTSEPAPDALKRTAESISDYVCKKLDKAPSPLSSDPFDTLKNWPVDYERLKLAAAEEQGFLEPHLRKLIPHIAIPLYYDNQYDEFLNKYIGYLRKLKVAAREINLVEEIGKYYDAVKDTNPGSDIEFKLRETRTQLKALATHQFDTPWAQIYIKNFLGLIERRLADKLRDPEGLHRAKELFSAVIREAEKINDEATTQDSRNLWLGFSHRNLAKVLDLLQHKTLAKNHFEQSEIYRLNTYQSLKGKVTHEIGGGFLFEQTLSGIDKLNFDASDEKAILGDAISAIRGHLQTGGRAIKETIEALRKYCEKVGRQETLAVVESLEKWLS